MEPLTDEQRDRLEGNLSYVKYATAYGANQYRDVIDYEDAYGHAVIGAIGAIHTHRDDGGASLGTHLRTRSFGAIRDFVRQDTKSRKPEAARKIRFAVRSEGITLQITDKKLAEVDELDSVNDVIARITHNREDRLILKLRILEDMDMKDIGSTIGVSESWISYRLKMLLASARAILTERN